eukprot:Blabericola_migrator_1__6679@NODE_3375_length_1824_cov_541_317018_g2103_i0_p1_GENE_NODE_3375_length_1824_cov_541_317018_g2103_i0NODE_3375_length_1824_cov_541_317018_g2103_i0_p1_ORF_typecomplete_len328_score85_42SIMPL/PF04402_14/6_8e27Mito_fiss_reg/PF05308_11/0_59_NODE_3375_length_1824_cov_541_317018_g2103_i04651448
MWWCTHTQSETHVSYVNPLSKLISHSIMFRLTVIACVTLVSLTHPDGELVVGRRIGVDDVFQRPRDPYGPSMMQVDSDTDNWPPPHGPPHRPPHRPPPGPPPSLREVQVVGRGVVTAKPDQARVHCFGRAQLPQARDAKKALDQVMFDMSQTLQDLGVSSDNITHTAFSVTRRTSWKDGKETFLHYEASQPVEVLLSLSNGTTILEEVVSGVLGVSTDEAVSVELSHIVPSLSDEETYLKAARKLAVTNAKSIAQQLAEPLDLRVGFAKRLALSGSGGEAPMIRLRSVAVDNSAAASVGDKTLTFEVEVEAVFDLLVERGRERPVAE